MRVTILFPDNSVHVDGVHRQVELPSYDPNWHALQWYDTYGDVEVKVGAPLLVEDFAVVAPFVQAWEAAAPVAPLAQPASAQPAPAQPATGVEEM